MKLRTFETEVSVILMAVCAFTSSLVNSSTMDTIGYDDQYLSGNAKLCLGVLSTACLQRQL